MSRYKLIANDSQSGDTYEIENQRKSTKAEIDQWMEDNIRASGLDWRVGYIIKFRNSDVRYEWLNIKDNQPVKISMY